MQHLDEYFGPGIDMRVPCLIGQREGTCCLSKDGLHGPTPFNHGDIYGDFFSFPSKHGWKVNPEDYGIEIDTNSRIDQSEDHIEDASTFIQSWLFFCLLNAVVRTDKPLLTMGELVSGTEVVEGGPWTEVTTKKLEEKITVWHDSMKAQPLKAKFRLIQTDLILAFARQVVRKNLVKDARFSDKIESNISLSIMILGETLSAVKSSILREMGETSLGWESDDLDGWGSPSCVLDSFRNICPYTKMVLEHQIGPNATMLLAASKHCKGHDGRDYGCTMTECKYIRAVRPAQDTSSTAHASSPGETGPADAYVPLCLCNEPCKLVGPRMEDVFEILRQPDASFPVFEVTESGDNEIHVAVKDWNKRELQEALATVSHVWSQGLGNPHSNKLHQCQLRFIKEALDGLSESMKAKNRMKPYRHLFWLDTFAVPVSGAEAEELSELRHLSISRMYDVYDTSNHSLVIDDDICKIENVGKGKELVLALRVLTSMWMRRLWTLQEAFLSKAMCFPTKKQNGKLAVENGHYPGKGFDKLIRELGHERGHKDSTILKVSLAEVLKRQLLDNLMGREREARIETGDPFTERGSQLIASAWRSARWRDTSHKEDETIILSTLLNLDFRDTSLESPTRYKDHGAQAAVNQRKLMMRDFLQLIARHCPGSIPAGIIFLQGERLDLPGFGWAPTTWTSRCNEDYPYPMSRMEHATELVPEGLLVRYPGIVLHCDKLSTVMPPMGEAFHFPVNRELSEWYSVELDKKSTFAQIEHVESDWSDTKSSHVLAIIISRPRPKEHLPDIGLLVNVYSSSWRRHEKRLHNDKLFYARTISRVKIIRAGPNWQKMVQETQRQTEVEQVIGERTKEDQLWCVDGFSTSQKRLEDLVDKRRKRGPVDNAPGSVAGTPLTVSQLPDPPRSYMGETSWGSILDNLWV